MAGLRRHDRVAYVAYNGHQLLEGYFGVLQAGGILLPINIRLNADEITYILNDAGIRYLLVDGDFAPLVETVYPRLAVPPTLIWLSDRPMGRSEPLYEVLLSAASPDHSRLQLDENAVAELFYTSGTTGSPKGVMLTHRNLYLHALACLATLPSEEQREVILHTIPLFHVNGWGTPQYLTAAGGTHVMMRKFDAGETLRLIEQEGVTRFSVVPTMLNMILNHPDIDRRDLSSLVLVIVGGSAAPQEMVRRAQSKLGCPVRGGYGLSETSPLLTLAVDAWPAATADADIVRQRSAAGAPSLGVELRILDPQDSPLPWDSRHVGEIAVRSNHVMEGYWNDPESTATAMTGGWFHTGDMATMDADGRVNIVDRKKDLIISGGENISSVEIEETLYEHPAVLEACVFAVPDENWGEVPKALVALREAAATTEKELLAFCRARLASFKLPQSIEIRESLPKGGTGKFLKSELREPYWSSQPERVHES
jgi:fatty-acyl-CoA synthase